MVTLAALMIAGEAIFGLPFHVARYFRPTLLAGLGLGNTELGAVFSAYGVLALLCYFPGGLLADRYPARRLLVAALVLTALGGVHLLTMPGLAQLMIVFALFGVTTVLLFWAALIRAVREWGEASRQGRAFGLLDGGRGLFSAALATLAWLALGAAFTRRSGGGERRGAAGGAAQRVRGVHRGDADRGGAGVAAGAGDADHDGGADGRGGAAAGAGVADVVAARAARAVCI
jgi:MFS family permease